MEKVDLTFLLKGRLFLFFYPIIPQCRSPVKDHFLLGTFLIQVEISLTQKLVMFIKARKPKRRFRISHPNDLQGVRIDIFFKVTLLAGRILYPEQTIILFQFYRNCMRDTNPMDGRLYLHIRLRSAALAIRQIGAPQLRDMTRPILDQFVALDDISAL